VLSEEGSVVFSGSGSLDVGSACFSVGICSVGSSVRGGKSDSVSIVVRAVSFASEGFSGATLVSSARGGSSESAISIGAIGSAALP